MGHGVDKAEQPCSAWRTKAVSPVIPRTPQRPAFVGHSFGGATVLQGLSDEASSNGGNAESEYSMAFVMDAWTYPISDEARDQSIRIPVSSGGVRNTIGVLFRWGRKNAQPRGLWLYACE